MVGSEHAPRDESGYATLDRSALPDAPSARIALNDLLVRLRLDTERAP